MYSSQRAGQRASQNHKNECGMLESHRLYNGFNYFHMQHRCKQNIIHAFKSVPDSLWSNKNRIATISGPKTTSINQINRLIYVWGYIWLSPITCVVLVVQIGTLHVRGQIDLPSGCRPPIGRHGPNGPGGPKFVFFTSEVKSIFCFYFFFPAQSICRPSSARRPPAVWHMGLLGRNYIRLGRVPGPFPYSVWPPELRLSYIGCSHIVIKFWIKPQGKVRLLRVIRTIYGIRLVQSKYSFGPGYPTKHLIESKY